MVRVENVLPITCAYKPPWGRERLKVLVSLLEFGHLVSFSQLFSRLSVSHLVAEIAASTEQKLV